VFDERKSTEKGFRHFRGKKRKGEGIQPTPIPLWRKKKRKEEEERDILSPQDRGYEVADRLSSKGEKKKRERETRSLNTLPQKAGKRKGRGVRRLAKKMKMKHQRKVTKRGEK